MSHDGWIELVDVCAMALCSSFCSSNLPTSATSGIKRHPKEWEGDSHDMPSSSGGIVKLEKNSNDPQPSVSLVYCRLYIIMMCTIVYTYIDYIVITLHAHLLYVSHRRPQNNQAITLHASSNGDFSASHKTSTYAMFSQQSPFLERASSAYAMAQKIMDCSWFFNLSAKRPILQHYLCNFVGHHHSSSTTFGPKSANII
jgi:hypothetical protein